MNRWECAGFIGIMQVQPIWRAHLQPAALKTELYFLVRQQIELLDRIKILGIHPMPQLQYLQNPMPIRLTYGLRSDLF